MADSNEWAGDHRGYRFGLIEPQPEVVARNLYAGDYSLLGHETRVVVERKSKADLYGTIARNFGDHHFSRRLEAMSLAKVAAVVVESDLTDCLVNPPGYAQTHPASVRGKILAWVFRYPVKWIFMSSPEAAEITTFRVLQRYWCSYVDRHH